VVFALGLAGTLAERAATLRGSPAVPLPNCHWLPFLDWCISRFCSPAEFLIELGAQSRDHVEQPSCVALAVVCSETSDQCEVGECAKAWETDALSSAVRSVPFGNVT
jgi:hypothetical protein